MSHGLMRDALLAAAFVLVAGGESQAAPVCSAKSGAQTVALVELYTSEGCDSCPPADRWLATTFGEGSEARAAALAFHVDYWDRLGWKDRFASTDYTARQYDVVRTGASRFAYTPQVLVQGRDVPDWGGRSADSGAMRAITAANATRARADIALEARMEERAIVVKATARVRAEDRAGGRLFVALTQDGLVSDVNAGENAGVRLTHDNVVRTLRTGSTVDGEGALRFDGSLALPTEGPARYSLVAFVQKPATGEVLQSLALPVSAEHCASR
jgi:hypothetical protein